MTTTLDGSVLLDDEPVVLQEPDKVLPCRYTGCKTPSSWSTLWTCGEIAPYCDQHLKWAEIRSKENGIHCDCPGNAGRIIHLVMTVPL